jgi:hypothetical protein
MHYLLFLFVVNRVALTSSFSLLRFFDNNNLKSSHTNIFGNVVKSHDSFQASVIASVVLPLLITWTEPAFAATSKESAQIYLESLPPSTVSVQISDLPVIGSLISGTYTKVPDDALINGRSPSVVIKSPKDKVSAIKAFLTTGHLEFDITGLLTTHVDMDLGTEEPGVARVRIAAPGIPTLPFHNAATQFTPPTGKKTPWSIVSNLGNGESYYYNEETGESQFERPEL